MKPYDFDETLRFRGFGPFDPTSRSAPGHLWKAGHTPEGPVTIHLARAPQAVQASAWGAGARWAIERVPELCGLADDPSAFVPTAPAVARLARRVRGVRLSRSPWVFDGLTHYILQQRVSFRDAARSHRRAVSALSAPAPGPARLRLPPSAAQWAGLGSSEFARFGIDRQRAAAVHAAARVGRSIDGFFDRSPAEARRLLATVAGCGPWTREITMGFVLGDPDAVPVGDLHLPHEVGWALAAEPEADDARMLALLEPFRGQRFRLIRLLLAAGHVRLGPGLPRARD